MRFEFMLVAWTAVTVMAAGSCGGDKTYQKCAGKCTETSLDVRNCGGCGIVCGADELCDRGKCRSNKCLANINEHCVYGRKRFWEARCSPDINNQCLCYGASSGGQKCAIPVGSIEYCEKDSDCKRAEGGFCLEDPCKDKPAGHAPTCRYTGPCPSI